MQEPKKKKKRGRQPTTSAPRPFKQWKAMQPGGRDVSYERYLEYLDHFPDHKNALLQKVSRLASLLASQSILIGFCCVPYRMPGK